MSIILNGLDVFNISVCGGQGEDMPLDSPILADSYVYTASWVLLPTSLPIRNFAGRILRKMGTEKK